MTSNNNSLIVSDRVNEVPKKFFSVNSDEKVGHCHHVTADGTSSIMQGIITSTNVALPMTGLFINNFCF